MTSSSRLNIIKFNNFTLKALLAAFLSRSISEVLMFTNEIIVETNKDVFWGRGISYSFLLFSMIMATRIFYLMFKNTAKWNVYKVAFDKREGIHNLISHLKCLVIVKITSIISLIIFDTSYAALFYVKMEDYEDNHIYDDPYQGQNQIPTTDLTQQNLPESA